MQRRLLCFNSDTLVVVLISLNKIPNLNRRVRHNYHRRTFAEAVIVLSHLRPDTDIILRSPLFKLFYYLTGARGWPKDVRNVAVKSKGQFSRR